MKYAMNNVETRFIRWIPADFSGYPAGSIRADQHFAIEQILLIRQIETDAVCLVVVALDNDY